MTLGCKDCGALIQVGQSTDLCPKCWGRNLEWRALSGKGKVFTFSVIHQVYHPGFKGETPYVTAVIELDEGARFLSNVVGCAPEDVKIDMPVEVYFEDINEDVTLPKFRPVG